MSSTSELALPCYRVQVWTAFTPNGDQNEEQRTDREENLRRFAAALRRSLADKCGQYEPDVKQTRVGETPQLVFEFVVCAEDGDDAIRKAKYWIHRGSSTTKTFERGGRTHARPVTMRFPYGQTIAELL